MRTYSKILIFFAIILLVSFVSIRREESQYIIIEENLLNTFLEEDENLKEGEKFLTIISYERGDFFYHFTIKCEKSLIVYENSKQKIEPFFIFSIPDSSNNFHIFVEGLENNEIEPIVIKSEGELEEKLIYIDTIVSENPRVVKKEISLSQDKEYKKELSLALKSDWLLGVIYPNYLYDEEENFRLRIEFDTMLHKSYRNTFYKNYFAWDIKNATEDFNRLCFILPQNSDPWLQNTGKYHFSYQEQEKNVLIWDMKENEVNYLRATFGTLEERLHWENKELATQQFIMTLAGLFLAITVPIRFIKSVKLLIYPEKRDLILNCGLVFFVTLIACYLIFYIKILEFPIKTDLHYWAGGTLFILVLIHFGLREFYEKYM